jgi:hypothetical protein
LKPDAIDSTTRSARWADWRISGKRPTERRSVRSLFRSARCWRTCTLLVLASSCAGLLEAQDSNLQIHGFGGWSYAKTDHGNLYLGGLPDGNFRRSDVSLDLEEKASDRIRVVLQTKFTNTESGSNVNLEYIFVEWRLSDKIRIRAGQVQLPFGIYSDITDVGTLRPFLQLPQAVYGPIGLVGQNYKGVGVTGNLNGPGKWSYGYDLYAGGMDIEEFRPPEAFLQGQPVTTSLETEQEGTRNLVGGRFTVHTPLDGLEFGVSAYNGTPNEVGLPRRSVGGVHVAFLNDRWSVRSEYAFEHAPLDMTTHGFYLEPAYRVTEHWQVAGQYDHLTSSLFGISKPSESSFLIHREAALGLNYWFSPRIVLKASLHEVNGNRFAAPVPERYAQLVANGELQHKTSLFMFGVNFSF